MAGRSPMERGGELTFVYALLDETRFVCWCWRGYEVDLRGLDPYR
jgi:hypothetical protein